MPIITNLRVTDMSIPFQLKLDFTPRVAAGKRTERITVTCSSEFKRLVDLICSFSGESVSELGHRYFLNGVRDDIGRFFISEPHIDKTLREVLSRGSLQHKKF